MEDLIIFWLANIGLYSLWIWRYGAGSLGAFLSAAVCVSLFYGYYFVFDQSGCGLWIFTVGFALLTGLIQNLVAWAVVVVWQRRTRGAI